MSPEGPETQKIRKLFEERVPSIVSGVVEIRGIVREPGVRALLAVVSNDPATDAVGACVGNHGRIVKEVAAELPGEHIDIVLWNDSVKQFLPNLFAPMLFLSVSLDDSSHQVTAVFRRDSEILPSRAVGLRSKLLTQLTGWVLEFEMET
jgi:N utilization substance protein A